MIDRIANRYAKKHVAAGGVFFLEAHPPERRALLSRLPLDEVGGIGRRLSSSLGEMEIYGAWELPGADPKRIRRKYSVAFEHMLLELRDIPSNEMNDPGMPRETS